MSRVLVFDLETSPVMALVWGVWKQNIPAKMIDQTWNILSYSAKWLGEDDIYYNDLRDQAVNGFVDDSELLVELYDLVSQADVLVAHNGDRFDIPRLNTRFLRAGLSPIHRIQSVDTCKIARRIFDFEHNSLEYLTTQLLPEEYHKRKSQKFHGVDLWLECLSGNIEAWDEMQDYNEQDVIALEALYLLIRSWDDRHPVMANLGEDLPDKPTCRVCESTNLHRRGYQHTRTMKYQRYRCMDCGAWSRSRFAEKQDERKRNILV